MMVFLYAWMPCGERDWERQHCFSPEKRKVRAYNVAEESEHRVLVLSTTPILQRHVFSDELERVVDSSVPEPRFPRGAYAWHGLDVGFDGAA
jgi:hypothetical protein